MATNNRSRKYLPHVVIIAIFIVVCCAFCFPMLKGEKMLPGDSFNSLCMSSESRDYFAQTGENAFWANNMFSGMPLAMTDMHIKNDWYRHVNLLLQGYPQNTTNNPIFLLLLAMVGFYILTLSLRIKKWIGAIGAIGYALSSYLPIIIAAGHITKMIDMAYLPGLLAGVIITYRGRYIAGAALTGLFLAMYLDASHYQIIYYSLFVIGVLVIAAFIRALKQQQLKCFFTASLCLAVVAALAAMTAATNLTTASAYNKYSMRGGTSELSSKQNKGGLDKDYAFQWSQGIGETFTILVPDLYGGASGAGVGEDSHLADALSNANVPQQNIDQITAQAPNYWGPQPFTSPVYFGAVICFLFVLSLFTIRSNHKWWVVALCAFFIVLSWGKNFPAFNDFMFDHFPMYNKFRTPSMALTMPLLFFPLLAAWGLCELIYSGGYNADEKWKKVRQALYITGGLCVLLLVGVWMFFDFKGNNDVMIQEQYNKMAQGIGDTIMRAVREDRASLATKDIFRSLVYILLTFAVLWAFAKNKVRATYAVAAIGLLITVDEFSVSKRYMNDNNFLDADTYEQQFAKTPIEEQITKDTTYYRVMDLTSDPFNSARPSLYYKNIGGYHPAKLEIYQDLIEHQISRNNGQVLNMLNTKYIVFSPKQGQPPMVQQNPGACGNAWFVNNIQWAATADAEMNALNAPALGSPADSGKSYFQPMQTAIVREKYKSRFASYNFGKDSSSYIRLTSYSPRTLEYESDNAQNGFAVFSEIYYPEGWTATIDGKEAPVYCVDYVLRGLQLPAGKHKIRFTFMLPGYEKGEKIALIGSILLTLILLAGLYVGFKRSKDEMEAVPPQPSKTVKPKNK